MHQLKIIPKLPAQEQILTAGAVRFLTELVNRFTPERDHLLNLRKQRQVTIDEGELPDFCPETAEIRSGDWRVAPLPREARDRRTEITGPVNRKMVINALNSGAQVFMADFEDSTAPTWSNIIDGQINLRDAVNGDIRFDAGQGKIYSLKDEIALLMVRPRGWHLPENHITCDGEPIPGALLDFGLFLYHNHENLSESGRHPFFYLPKLEHYLEARLWNDVINWSEDKLGLEQGSVKVTVLIETLPAAFQMDEILYELRSRIQGLNCGRWDYIFSYIKSLRNHPGFLLPDRAAVTMDRGFLKAYSSLLVRACHRRGAMAMGGMAAQIPIKNDEQANREALDKVRADKYREAHAGHDGTWVAHPGLEAIARAEFDAVLTGANQIDRPPEDLDIGRDDLLKPIGGAITRNGVEGNIRVALRYLAAWLGGNGCVPIDHLMEDAATAEISRAQLWQWIRHPGAVLEDGGAIDESLYSAMRSEILEELVKNVPEDQVRLLHSAAELMDELTLNDDFAEFLTLQAYEIIC